MRPFLLATSTAGLLGACAIAPHHTHPNPFLTSGESRFLCAVVEAGEEGGYGAYAMGISNYPYRVAKAVSDGYRNPKLILPVLIASNHTDAAAAEMQTDILAAVLQGSGDSAFAMAMRDVDPPSRRISSLLLRKVFKGKTNPWPVALDPKSYPETFSIVIANSAD